MGKLLPPINNHKEEIKIKIISKIVIIKISMALLGKGAEAGVARTKIENQIIILIITIIILMPIQIKMTRGSISHHVGSISRSSLKFRIFQGLAQRNIILIDANHT